VAQGAPNPRAAAAAAVSSALGTESGATSSSAVAVAGHGDVATAAHGAVAHGPSSTVISYNPDAPSEAWGWHGHWREFAPKSSGFLLWLGVALLLCLNFTTHVSHIESWYYNGTAIIMAIWLVWRNVTFRRAKRRRQSPIGD
jgi:hypothetical protein